MVSFSSRDAHNQAPRGEKPEAAPEGAICDYWQARHSAYCLLPEERNPQRIFVFCKFRSRLTHWGYPHPGVCEGLIRTTVHVSHFGSRFPFYCTLQIKKNVPSVPAADLYCKFSEITSDSMLFAFCRNAGDCWKAF